MSQSFVIFSSIAVPGTNAEEVCKKDLKEELYTSDYDLCGLSEVGGGKRIFFRPAVALVEIWTVFFNKFSYHQIALDIFWIQSTIPKQEQVWRQCAKGQIIEALTWLWRLVKFPLLLVWGNGKGALCSKSKVVGGEWRLERGRNGKDSWPTHKTSFPGLLWWCSPLIGSQQQHCYKFPLPHGCAFRSEVCELHLQDRLAPSSSFSSAGPAMVCWLLSWREEIPTRAAIVSYNKWA